MSSWAQIVSNARKCMRTRTDSSNGSVEYPLPIFVPACQRKASDSPSTATVTSTPRSTMPTRKTYASCLVAPNSTSTSAGKGKSKLPLTPSTSTTTSKTSSNPGSTFLMGHDTPKSSTSPDHDIDSLVLASPSLSEGQVSSNGSGTSASPSHSRRHSLSDSYSDLGSGNDSEPESIFDYESLSHSRSHSHSYPHRRRSSSHHHATSSPSHGRWQSPETTLDISSTSSTFSSYFFLSEQDGLYISYAEVEAALEGYPELDSEEEYEEDSTPCAWPPRCPTNFTTTTQLEFTNAYSYSSSLIHVSSHWPTFDRIARGSRLPPSALSSSSW